MKLKLKIVRIENDQLRQVRIEENTALNQIKSRIFYLNLLTQAWIFAICI